MKKTSTLVLLLLVLMAPALKAQGLLSPQVDSIPMSDGRKLAADIYKPSGISTGPVILIQTPYNRQLYRNSLPLKVGLNLNSSNYIFVIVDWRGFYGSAGAAYAGSPNMGQDGYSVVEWIAQQAWSNEKIGTWGPSALGRVQFQTAKTNPPHLTCICPLVAGPQYDYDEYYPNGALRTEYLQQLDALGFGLKATVMAHPVHDATWTFVENANFYPDSIRVPCFMIGGWYDHTIEQMLPFFSALQTESPANVQAQHRLLMGPWVHGGHGTSYVGSATQGQLNYANAAGWSDSLALQYFDFHLRSIANGWGTTPAVTYYQMGDNGWQNSPSWPPAGTTNTNFYFHTNNTLDNSVPTNSTGKVNYFYSPNDPSPTVGGPTLKAGLNQGPYDQSLIVETRQDIALFTTATLTQDAVMKGSAVLHLKVSSDKTDTDFDIRLTDVYPDGKSMIVNDGVMRMRFRNGTRAVDTSAIVPGQVYDCEITLPNTSITFKAGHKIRVDVSSSNYPRFNRNMNTGGPMYPGNSLDSLVNPVTALNSVYTNSTNASYITLPLVGYTTAIENVSPQQNIRMFPNPISGCLNITSDNGDAYRVSVFNSTGQEVVSSNFSGNTTVDFKNLTKGIYIVELYNAATKEVVREKVINLE